MRTGLFIAIVTLLLLGIHAAGYIWSLYFTTNWYDAPAHFLGGVWVAALLLHFFKIKTVPLILIVFTVGVLWELFELSVNGLGVFAYRIPFRYDVVDTLMDLLMDTLGAALIALGTIRTRLPRQRKAR